MKYEEALQQLETIVKKMESGEYSVDELADATAMARASGIRHIIVDARDLDDPQIVKNDKERCYYCKRGRFQKLVAWARENGFAFVADGGNLDDKNDYRPGMKAIEELAPTVISPFIECGWTKADIRRQAREWGLSVADKTSAACLACRVEPLPKRAQRQQRQPLVGQEALAQPPCR